MSKQFLRQFPYKLFRLRVNRVQQFKRVISSSKDLKMAGLALERLKTEFGYVFNKEGQLRKFDEETNEAGDEPFQFDVYGGNQAKNQERYEKIANLIPEVIYDLLEKNGMTRIYLPPNTPKEECTFIFTQPSELDKPKKLLVLIHGSGFVRAGQWARSLIINNSLDHGTQIPYIKEGQKLGYDILITNTNDNHRVINGLEKAIPNLSTPSQHARYVWENIVMASEPEAVAIVAHSYGGTITVELAEEFTKFFEEKVFAIAFTDSAHYRIPKKACGVLKNTACNWIASSKPLDTEISKEGAVMRNVSAGHPKHEWTSWAAKSSVFQYLEDKYVRFTQERASKRPKLCC